MINKINKNKPTKIKTNFGKQREKMKRKLEDIGKRNGKSVSFNVNNETYLSMLKIAYELNLSFSEYIRKIHYEFCKKNFPNEYDKINIVLPNFNNKEWFEIETTDDIIDTVIRILEEYDLNSIKKEIQKKRSKSKYFQEISQLLAYKENNIKINNEIIDNWKNEKPKTNDLLEKYYIGFCLILFHLEYQEKE